MKTKEELRTSLRAIDHKSYPAYKSLAGSWSFGHYTLNIEHVQGDPFAAPSQLSVTVDSQTAGFPAGYWGPPGTALPWRTIFFGVLAARPDTFPTRPRDPEKAGFWLSLLQARRFWSGRTVRCAPEPSLCALRQAFQPMGGPSMPGSWRRSCSTSYLSAWNRGYCMPVLRKRI